ncbi:amidase [Facklamia hominis]|uniref:amidase n=1 Tax=Facklamia hominis TaxID=178214 RepID=UPI0038FCCA49
MVETLLNNKKLTVSPHPPYDALQAFVRENHIALEGAAKGPLKGMAFAVKDVFDIVGSTYSNGHPAWLHTHEPATETSSFIVNMLEAGADLVGKTICDELCYSISGENWNYGSPINPHDTRRYCGGSSSGTGAATAGGYVDVAFGSDCLGSVRVPAAYNGVLGIRPTLYRVDNSGEAPYCKSMDVLGFVAKEPTVFEQVAEFILGQDLHQTTLKRLFIPTDILNVVDSDVRKHVQKSIEFIKGYFDEVVEGSICNGDLNDWVKVFQHIQGYEVWESYGGWIRKYRPQLSEGPGSRLEWASTINYAQYQAALKAREEIIAQVDQVIGEDTVVVLPTAASIAPLRTATEEFINHTRLQSSQLLCVSPLSGVPQVTMPLATMEDVPLGISFLSPRQSDLQLVRLAARITQDYINT